MPGLEKFVMKADQWVNKAQMLLRDFEPKPGNNSSSNSNTATQFGPFQRIEFLEQLANELPDIPFHSPETEQIKYWATKVTDFLDNIEKSVQENSSEDYQHGVLAQAAQLGLPISNLDRMMKIKKWTDLVSNAHKISSDDKILSTIQHLYQQGLELQIPLPLPAALAALISNEDFGPKQRNKKMMLKIIMLKRVMKRFQQSSNLGLMTMLTSLKRNAHQL